MFRHISALLGLCTILTSCKDDPGVYEVVVLPTSNEFALGEAIAMELYVTRKFVQEDVLLTTDQEGVAYEYREGGTLILSKLEREPGEKSLSGSIKLVDGGTILPFQVDMIVAKPSAIASSNVLVRGRKNRVHVGIPGIPDSSITLAVTNGVAIREDGHYYVTPHDHDTVRVMLFYRSSFGTMHGTDPIMFEVVDVR